MFKRKWHWGLSAVVVFCLGGITFFLKSKAETQEPIKVYKVVTPDPKPIPTKSSTVETEGTTPHSHDHNDGHNHEHFHEPGQHSHAAETTPSSGEYDWRDDSTFDSSTSKSDPWEQTYPEQESTDAADDIYPPRDWYKTEDPELRAEYLYAQLIKQFGDTPEVQAIGEYELKAAQGIPPTLEEYTAYLEGHYHLFPNKQNQQTLDNLRKAIASGHKIIFE